MKETKYNITDETWHNVADNHNIWIKWRFEILKVLMKKAKIDLKKNYKCLDVGCGRNNFSLDLENISNFIIDQVDVDMNILNNKKKGRGLLFEYDINNRNQNLENKYDIIFLLDVLEHIENDKEFLQSCYFHLKKDGFLIVNVPSIPELFSKYDNAVGHLRRYKKENLKNLLLENKFNVIFMKYWGFLLIPLLFLRKIMVSLSRRDNAELIKKGMNTKSIPVLIVINVLRYLELKIIKVSFFGTSLISIVKK